jgi:carboxyl-terminal processing protease
MVLRGKEQKPFTITRGFIPIYSLDAAYMLNDATGFIRLNKFSETTYEEFMASLEKLQKQGMKELILDLRDNGGGIMDEAVEIADEFLAGNKLIVYTEGKHTPRKEYNCRRNGLFENGKLILLMNEGSASASEVLAGALQDWDRATVIGRRSFGKGLVQEQYNLRDGSALRLTVARYYSPLCRSIQKSYTNGIDKYNEEILDRYHNGKLVNADSNKNTNGKAYVTGEGKKVYGGGGISPDIFMPLDTLLLDTSLAPLYTRNTMGNFAYRYYISHKPSFEQYKNPTEFSNSYSVNDAVLDELMLFAKKDSIEVKPLSVATKDRLRLRLKSLLARQQWRSEGYFEVVNAEDKMVRKALEALKN